MTLRGEREYCLEDYELIEKTMSSDDVAKLTLDLVRKPSPTGNEIAACHFYAEKLREFGLDVELDHSVAQDRPNVKVVADFANVCVITGHLAHP